MEAVVCIESGKNYFRLNLTNIKFDQLGYQVDFHLPETFLSAPASKIATLRWSTVKKIVELRSPRNRNPDKWPDPNLISRLENPIIRLEA